MRLFDEIRYFFYITNDRKIEAEGVVFQANDRCDQENKIAQLAGGVRALSAPVDNLLSNWAYMVATALAWNLKSWWALWLPEKGRWHDKHAADKGSDSGDGIQDLPQRLHQDSLPDHPWRSAIGLPRAQLQPAPVGVLPHGKRTALLTKQTLKPESGCSGPPPRLTAPKCNRVP